MLLYSVEEIVYMLLAAILIDLLVGDPRWLPHPVIWMGKLIKGLEKLLYKDEAVHRLRLQGILLTLITIAMVYASTWFIIYVSQMIHPVVGYCVSVWLISTTIAIKGLKDAALLVYNALMENKLQEARKYVGYIVGRDTVGMDEKEMTRATVETVAENIVDAVISPIFYALLGGAPLAMLYRATNTMDSMVGYKNDRYLEFGWASARWDDLLNWIPARLTGLLLCLAALCIPRLSAPRAWRAMYTFSNLHPSPNSGIPESAVAGALGIQLGGLNLYQGRISERAKMGWPIRELNKTDILQAIYILYVVSVFSVGGMLFAIVV